MGSPYAIEMLNITKRFPGIIANDNITLQLKKGEIHALLGENGAGKSTLMSVLFGLYQPEEGVIKKDGQVVSIKDPNDANALGIGMVHQHFKLVECFTVLDNIIMGVEPTKCGFLQKKEAREKVIALSEKYGLKIISIADLIAYRLRNESIVERGETAEMPTEYGMFKITVFRQKSNGLEHMVLTKGEWTEDEPVLLRVHSSCATGDILGSCRCDCGAQLHEAMRMIEKEGKGAIVYLSQEGRGIGLFNKIAAYKLQDEGLDTVDANVRLGFGVDERDYGVGASIIREMGIKHMRLMTNNPLKRVGLEGYGLKIDEIVPIVIAPNKYNERYLETKQERMHHKLNLCKH